MIVFGNQDFHVLKRNENKQVLKITFMIKRRFGFYRIENIFKHANDM